jgi:hypothetical protein
MIGGMNRLGQDPKRPDRRSPLGAVRDMGEWRHQIGHRFVSRLPDAQIEGASAPMPSGD